MKDANKTKEQLINELEEMRRLVSEHEASEGERKESEKKLHQSEDKFKTITETSIDSIYQLDKDGTVFFMNEAGARMAGYTCEEMIGKNFTEMVNEARLPGVAELVEKVLSGEPTRGEVYVEHKDGHEFPIQFSIVPIERNGEIIGFTGVARDITKEKKLEHSLGERVKELDCLYSIANIVERPGVTLEEIYQETAGIISRSWQYPEITCAKITIDGKEFKTDNCETTGYLQSADIIIREYKRGTVEVYYLEDKPDIDEGPFLKEERLLIDAVAERLSRVTEHMHMERELRRHHDHLEELVKERTTELEAVNETLRKEITERKQIENTLRESEERYRTLLDTAGDSGLGVVVIQNTEDQEAAIVFLNNQVSNITGYSSEELLDKSAWDILTPESLLIVQERYRKRRKGEDITNNYETVGIRKDGTQVPVEVSVGTMIYDRKPATVAFIEDITGRKKAEETLHNSEESYRNLVELAPDGIMTVDENGVVVACNRAFTNITGYSKEEITGKHFLELPTIVAGDAERYAELFVAVLTKEKLGPFELPWIHKDGSYRMGETHATAMVVDGQSKGLQAIMRDITERNKVEKALRESEDKLRSMFENANDGIALHDLNGNFIDVNKNTLKILGLSSKEEILGKNNLQFVAPEDHNAAAEDMKILIEQGHISGIEHLALRKDGSSVLVELNAGLIKDSHGNPSSIISIFRDISTRKAIEEELQRAAKLESIGKLAGGIAHDFNNLIIGIMGNIGLVKRAVGTDRNDQTNQLLEEAEEASLRAKDLTQQLLTFSRGGTPIKKTVSIGGLLKESTGFALRGSNIRCDYSLPDDLWPVEIDEGQINQAITNLVINAEQAMPEGGVINVSASNIEIEDRSNLPLGKGRYVLISVADRGVGIKETHINQVFDPYFTTKQKGSGLGLTATYSIIKNHGGHITVKSHRGVGTTFDIYLPASYKQVSVKKEAIEEAPVRGEGNILIMDDIERVRKVLSKILSLAGYQVTLAEDGAETIEQYTKAKESGQPFDAVIMDLTITGGMGGKEAVKKLLEIDPDAKVIVSSGYATDPIMSHYKKYGFAAVLTKPYSVDQLEKTVHSVLVKKK